MSLAEPIRSEIDNSVPANLDAEAALLGAALYDGEAVNLAGAVRPEHFREPLHGRLWAAIIEHAARGLVDPTLIAGVFASDVAFAEIGGVRYLSDLVDRAPPPMRAPYYAAEITDLATRRALIEAAFQISTSARDRSAPALDHLHGAERALADIASTAGSPVAWVSASSVVAHAIAIAKASRGLPGLTTGLRELDEATGGLRRGVLTIVAGRPSMGKSSGALALAKACAQNGKGALFFSMEMPEFDLGLRLACDLAYDPYAPFISGRKDNPCYFDAAAGRLISDHWRRLDEAAEIVSAWPLEFDPRPGLTVPQMLAAARRRIREWERSGTEPGAIFVDHLTIARPDQDRKGNKVAEVGDISRGLAEMAKSLNLPVVALCQLSRDVEKRQSGDRRPTLADLRWAGEIEQDARLVMFLYRPEYYVRKPEDPTDFEADTEWKAKLKKHRHKLFWIVGKNNNGPDGLEVETHCDIACSAIRDKLGI